jgi:hypothetical protein
MAQVEGWWSQPERPVGAQERAGQCLTGPKGSGCRNRLAHSLVRLSVRDARRVASTVGVSTVDEPSCGLEPARGASREVSVRRRQLVSGPRPDCGGGGGSYGSSGPALAKPCRTPCPARAVSASGS